MSNYIKHLEKNKDYILAVWQSALKEQEKYNGWSNDSPDLIKKYIYDSIIQKAGYDIFYKLKLENYLGAEHTDKLFYILHKWNHYEVFQFIFDDCMGNHHVGEPPNFETLSIVKTKIDSTLKRVEFLDNCFYQCFYFRHTIKDFFYDGGISVGDESISVEEQMDKALEICELNDPKDFFPKLQSTIGNIIGEQNCEYDFYEMGSKGFTLYWSISKDVYYEKLNEIKEWLKYNELEDFMAFKIKDESSTNDTPIYKETIGNKEVIRDYYND